MFVYEFTDKEHFQKYLQTFDHISDIVLGIQSS